MPVYRLLGGASREAVLVYGHASGADMDGAMESVAALRRQGIPRRADAERHPRRAVHLRHRQGLGALRPGGEGAAARARVEHRALPRLHPDALRPGPERVRPGAAPAPRRPPPPDAHRGGSARQGARAVSPLLDRGPDPGRDAGGLPPASASTRRPPSRSARC